ncbi:MAG: RluA family pseudouridine synthase [bacterium]|nr:RluA family pseudouridine synthase [bacterium]
MVSRVEITVDESERKMRLEDVLCSRFPALSKMYLREVVKNGDCEVNGRHENRGKRLLPRDFVEVKVDLTRENSMLPQDIPLEIVYEDADLLVVNKPSGMLVHPSHCEKNGTLLNAVVHHMNHSDGKTHQRPGLVHRLDKDTSGLIMIARNSRAHRILCLQFHNKKVEKRYVALVDGIVVKDQGSIEGKIGRNADAKLWELREDGKLAETRYQVIERRENTTLMELEPVTGRTNQLRIHCAAFGHPIVGDTMRGGSGFRRMCLHSARLGFRLPSTGLQLGLTSSPDFI